MWEEGGPELPACGGRLCQAGAGLPGEGPQGSARGSRSAVPASGGPGPQGPRELGDSQASGRAGDGHSSLHLESQVGPRPRGGAPGVRKPASKVEADVGFRWLEQGGCSRGRGCRREGQRGHQRRAGDAEGRG